MKKTGIVIIAVILAFVGIIVLWGVSINNSLVSKEESVEKAIGDVQAEYQKRADLIPNVVAAAKQYSNYEGEAFTKIIEARNQAHQQQIDFDNMTEEQLANYQKMQEEAMGVMKTNLNVIVEAYPQLKANELYLNLQKNLESCENGIANARRIFNEKAREYNTSRKRFPNNLIAGMLGFSEKPYFQASEGAQNAPNVKDLFND